MWRVPDKSHPRHFRQGEEDFAAIKTRVLEIRASKTPVPDFLSL
jgi:hypothetical protein